MPRPEALKDMDFEQKIAWAVETVMDGIRKESLRDGMVTVISGIMSESFSRGVVCGRDQERRQQREKNKRKRTRTA